MVACQSYFEQPDDPVKLEAAFESVLPILGIVIRQNFKTVQPDDLDDLIQGATIEYWKFLSEKKPRPYDIRSHFNLYYKIGWRAMIKAKNLISSDIIDFFAVNKLPPTASCNFVKPEQRVFIQQLPLIVYESVIEKVLESRFQDPEEQAVCEYLARCLIFNERVSKRRLRALAGRSVNAAFLEGFVDTLVKIAFHELKESTDISSMLAEEGAALKAMYYHVERLDKTGQRDYR